MPQHTSVWCVRACCKSRAIWTAPREIQTVVDLMQTSAPAAVREEVIAQQVRVLLAQDRLTMAESVLQPWATFAPSKLSSHDLDTAHTITYPRGLIASSVLRVMLHRSQAAHDVVSLRAGIELADRLIDLAVQGQYFTIVLVALLLRARMQAALGNERASLTDSLTALELAEPEGCTLIFLEEGPAIRPLLQAVADRAATPDRLKAYARELLAAFPTLD